MWAYLYMMQIFPEAHVSLALHVWNAYIPQNKCEPSSTCLMKCTDSPKQMWVYLYMSEMQIFPETMWAYLYMPEMHIFPETNVSLLVWRLHLREFFSYSN